MATLNLGKISLNFRGAFDATIAYSKNDAVSSGGSSWIAIIDQTAPAFSNTTTYSLNDLVTDGGNVFRYINATAAAGNATTVATHWAANTPSSTNTTFWNIIAEGTAILTTAGDVLTHDGTSQVRLPRGAGGQVLKVSGTSVGFSNESGFKNLTVLESNYGDPIQWNQNPSAATTYGATGSRPWLADYSNNWIPQYAFPNPACGPVANAEQGNQYHNYRLQTFINNEHEICVMGSDAGSYASNGIHSGNGHSMYPLMNICTDNGGMRDGDYFVRHWNSSHCMWALTKDGDLFSRGYNAYGQLGVGDTTNRYMWCKVATLGPDATHAGTSCQIAGFYPCISSDTGGASYNHCFAIDTSGRLFAWGHGANGKLGLGNTDNQTLPVHVSSVSNICMISGRYGSTHIVDTSGNLFFAGSSQNEIDGGLSSGTLSSFTDTGQNNVYQILNSDGYYYTTRYAHGYYINTSGEMYGIGGNAIGAVGVGSTSAVGTWSRIGGSATYSGAVLAGNSYYLSVGVLGGTPASPDNTVSVWGFNTNGQLGMGDTTHRQAPVSPSTTTVYTHTVASTTSNAAMTQVDVPFPGTAIRRIWANRGMQGQQTANFFFQDDKYRTWMSGYSNSQDYNKASTGNAVINNIRLDVAQENTTSTVGTSHWAGSVETQVNHMHGGGNAYNSEGIMLKYTTDGRIYGWGYNGQGALEPAATYVGNWIQMRP